MPAQPRQPERFFSGVGVVGVGGAAATGGDVRVTGGEGVCGGIGGGDAG